LRQEAAKGAERLHPYGKTLRDAVNFFLRHLASVLRNASVAELVEKYIASKTVLGRSPVHLADLKTRLGRFAKAFGSRKHHPGCRELAGWHSAFRTECQSPPRQGFFPY
jgi:hypothetical protein